MSYIVNKTNGSVLAEVAEQTINSSACSLGLIGRGAVNYGETLSENFVKLLENFANPTAPPRPIAGQIWYDTTTGIAKVYSGTTWSALATSIDSNTGTGFANIQIGTEYAIAMIASGRIVGIVTHVEVAYGDLPTSVAIAGTDFTLRTRFPNGLFPGINLATDPNGYAFVGAIKGAADSAKKLTNAVTISLGGEATGSALFDGSANVTIPVSLISTGVTSGTYMQVTVDSKGRITSGSNPTSTDWLAILGSAATSAAVPNTLVKRDAQANFAANTITATATAALYADLAERFAASEPLEPGDVVEIGGSAEVRKSSSFSNDVLGVVSTNPAVRMNEQAGDDVTHPFVAFAGRVPCKVVGPVRKGQRLVASQHPGVAIASDHFDGLAVIGRALADKTTDDVGTVEIVVGVPR